MLQVSHFKFLLLLWVLRWFLRFVFVLNNLPHSKQSKNLIWLWLIECCLTSALFLNDFPHWGHLKFLAVWWKLWPWLFKSGFVLKDFKQTWLWNPLLSSWYLTWSFNSFLLLKLFSQILHSKSLRSLWTTEWTFKVLSLLNLFPHTMLERICIVMSLSVFLQRLFCFKFFSHKFYIHISHRLSVFKCCLGIWALNHCFNLKHFPQKLHSWIANLAWIWTCRWIFYFAGKTFPQMSHSNDLWAEVSFVVGCENLQS